MLLISLAGGGFGGGGFGWARQWWPTKLELDPKLVVLMQARRRRETSNSWKMKMMIKMKSLQSPGIQKKLIKHQILSCMLYILHVLCFLN